MAKSCGIRSLYTPTSDWKPSKLHPVIKAPYHWVAYRPYEDDMVERVSGWAQTPLESADAIKEALR